MKKIDDYIVARREHARIYNSILKDVDGIKLPPEADNVKNVYWLYSILIQDDFGIKRDDLAIELYKKGIETRPFFIPMHKQPVFQKMGFIKGGFPIAEELGKKGICLPSSSSLTKDQIEYVCDSIKEIQKSAK